MISKKKKVLTITCIADALGVSVSTVSRALQGHAKVADETKRKVSNYALVNGYEPNILAVNLRLQKSRTIGVIVPSFTDPFFAEVLDVIETNARRQNYNVLLGNSNDNSEKEADLFHSLRLRRVDGMIMSLSPKSMFLKRRNFESGATLPLVFFNHVPGFSGIRADAISCDGYNGMLKLMSWFFQNNRRHIGFINGPSDLLLSKELLQAYMHSWSIRRRKIDMQLVESTDLSKEGNRQAISTLLKRNCKLDAVISFNDHVHIDAVEAAAELGIVVNQDIIFGSTAGRSFSQYLRQPPRVSLNPFPAKQGQMAFNALLQQINRGKIVSPFSYKKIEADIIV